MPPRPPRAATLALLAGLLAVAPPGNALAGLTPAPCRAEQVFPLDGATSVALDVVVSGQSVCPLREPGLTDDSGQSVPIDVVVDAGKFQLVPKAPLAPDRTYTAVFFRDLAGCGATASQVRFRTGGSPGVREVEFATVGTTIFGIDVHLSEPVLVPADLAEATTLVSVEVDGFALAPTIQPLADSGGFKAYYKTLPQQPTLTGTVHVRLHQGLRFASGKVLAEAVEVTIPVPAGLSGNVWRPTGKAPACAGGGDTGRVDGCSTRRTAAGGMGVTVLGVLTGLAVSLARRRQRLGL